MSEPTYQIVFRGKILGGFDREQVRANLSRLFKIDPARVDAMLDAPKTVLKTGVGKDAASRYQEALRQAGIMVAVMGESAATSASPPLGAPSTLATTREIAPVPEPVSAPRAPVATQAIGTPAPPAPPPAESTVSGLTLAEPGVQLLPPQVRSKAEIDTSALSLAQPGVVLVEKRQVTAPQYDLSGISLGNADEPIIPQHKAQPAAIDTSALSLAEQAPEVEKPLTELQKLLTSSVE
jgi:hypothetical protein